MITVELLLTLPVLLIFLAAIIEYGLIFAVNQKVAYSSRFGARLASIESRNTLGDMNLSSGGSRLRTAIDRFLSTAEIDTGACTVILEHNADLPNQSQTDTDGSGCNCGPPSTPLPAGPPPGENSEYVRVTVCVPLAGNVPDFLSSYGFSIADCTIEHSTVFRYGSSCLPPDAVISSSPQPLVTGLAVIPDLINADQTFLPGATITVNADNLLASGTTFTFKFNADQSTDPEDPFSALMFKWTTNGMPLGPDDESDFEVEFTVPGLAGGVLAQESFEVTLEVTDTCGNTDTETVIVDIVRLPI